MPNVLGRMNRVIFGSIGSAGGSGTTIPVPTPDTGRSFVLDWLNLIVRNAAVGNAYLEVTVPISEGGASNVTLTFPLTNGGAVAAGATYGIHAAGLGIPVNPTGNLVVTLKDNTGAASNTTATNGAIIGAWGFKNFPYDDH